VLGLWWREPSPRAPDPGAVSLVGWYFVFLISWALNAIRMFLVLAAILTASLLLLFVTYVQSPRHLLLIVAWGMVALCLAVRGRVLFRMERTETLSQMSGTGPGSVTFDTSFLKTTGTLLAGPVLAIVALEFPQFGRWLAEWAQPVLRTLK